jgi:metal-responsive CopG/Arc/MetJ family transcriptional regulator
MSNAKYTHRLSVYITDGMNAKLTELATKRTRSKGQQVSKADLIREALRLYLNEQTDLRGSRKQIAKSLECQLSDTETRLTELLHQQNAALVQTCQTMLNLDQQLQPLVKIAEKREKKANESQTNGGGKRPV